MKKLITFIAVMFVCLSANAQASFFAKITKDGVAPCATMYGTKSLSKNKNFGFTYFGLVQESWAEIQFGLYYNLTSWSQVGLSLGLEQGGKLFRTGGFIWLGKGNSSFIALAEKGIGKGNYFYKVTLNQKVGDFDLGLRGWRYTGFGPIIQYKIGDTGLKAWIMPAFGWFESSKNSIVIGLDFKF